MSQRMNCLEIGVHDIIPLQRLDLSVGVWLARYPHTIREGREEVKRQWVINCLEIGLDGMIPLTSLDLDVGAGF